MNTLTIINIASPTAIVLSAIGLGFYAVKKGYKVEPKAPATQRAPKPDADERTKPLRGAA